MLHPLIQRLLDEHDFPAVDLHTFSGFTDMADVAVLFFPGDPAQFKDTTDVAVVLPEIVKAARGQLRAGVVLDVESDRVLRERYGFAKYPALVFLRGDVLLGTLCGIRDWSEYLTEITGYLAVDRRGGGRIPVRHVDRGATVGQDRA